MNFHDKMTHLFFQKEALKGKTVKVVISHQALICLKKLKKIFYEYILYINILYNKFIWLNESEFIFNTFATENFLLEKKTNEPFVFKMKET